MPIKFCSEAYFFQAWDSLTSLKSQTWDPGLKSLPEDLCSGFLRPKKSIEQTLDLEASTLPRDHRGGQTPFYTFIKILHTYFLFIKQISIKLNEKSRYWRWRIAHCWIYFFNKITSVGKKNNSRKLLKYLLTKNDLIIHPNNFKFNYNPCW